jgi:hypothetical protein
VTSKGFYIYPKNKVERLVYKEWFEGKDLKRNFETTGTSLQQPDAMFVAMAKSCFGEGIKRCAFRFYYLASDAKTIVGQQMVAKESRLLLDAEKAANEAAAGRLAHEFNHKMDGTRRIHPSTPRVTIGTIYQRIIVDELFLYFKNKNCQYGVAL